MIIKVCGLRDPENIRNVASIKGVDWMGMIFYPKSPRYVASEETSDAVSALNTVERVGVFVNENCEEVVRKCAQYHLDCIQLHGNETPEYLKTLRKLIPKGIKFIKAFSIRIAEDLLPASGYEDLCEYFLFDTATPDYGGSGRAFDWQILQSYKGLTPFLLSGGIGPDSLQALQDFQHPQCAGVDLNSRFETAPGIKDIRLLSDFVQQLKSKHL